MSSRQNPNEEIEALVHNAIGPSDFMEFIRFDLGEVLRKDRGKQAPRSLRLVIGNPLIMKQMVDHVPDAGSYAPVTILIDERTDGVHLSYDRMASLLASYGGGEALEVARKLDAKVERLLSAVANGRDLALLFKDLATLRTDARLFGDVDEVWWRGPTKAFAACAKHLRDARLLERSLKAPVA